MTTDYQMTTDDQISADDQQNLSKLFDQTASFFSPPLSDSSPEEEKFRTIIIVIRSNIIT